MQTTETRPVPGPAFDSFTVFIIEASTITRAGVRAYIAESGRGRVVGEASDPLAAIVGLKHNPADIILLEAGGGITSPESIRKLRECAPSSRILLLTLTVSFNEIALLIEAGANGSVLKAADSATFFSAIDAVLKGGLYLPSEVASQYFGQRSATPENSFGLTAREEQILALVAEGMSNKEIANQMGLSVRTVETHRLNIRRKTSCNTLSDLVRLSRRIKASREAH